MKTCGLDVHKNIIFCAIYDGEVSVVKQFSSFTPDLRDMCQYIKGEGVATVAMERTGHLQRFGRNSYKLKNNKTNYSYGSLGNPYFNNNSYKITIKSRDTVILQKGQWETPLLFIERDSIPAEFDFKKYGYDMYSN